MGVRQVHLLRLLDQALRGQRGAGAERDHGEELRQRQPLRLLVGLRDGGVDGQEGPRLGQLRRGAELRAVELERLRRPGPGEVVGEDVGHALLGGQPGGVVRRAQQPDRRDAGGAGGGPQLVPPPLDRQADAGGVHHRQHVVDVLGEPVHGLVGHPAGAVPQRPAGHRVGAGRPADAEVDPARGARPRAARTARRRPAGRGSAASRRRSRPGSARSRPRPWRSGPAGWWRPRPACCGARPASTGGSPARRPPGPATRSPPARRRSTGRCGPARGRARTASYVGWSL